ncbi:MAG: TonB family protein [Polyangiaceae bacterium]
MPKVLTQVEPVFPPAALADHRDGTVALAVTVGSDGTVTAVEVLESGGTDFDEAAMSAVRQWMFSPAMRGDRAIAVKIRVPIRFVPPTRTGPEAPLAPATSGTPRVQASPKATAVPTARTTRAPPAADAAAPAEQPFPDPEAAGASEVTVTGRRQPPVVAASDHRIEVGALAMVPRQNAAGMLTLAPGIYLSNDGGEGHAERVYLRGFDAREGQDIEFSVGGVPVNESGNLHGNGFADLHFIIPELVTRLRVVEGPFDPRQGNYAVAGSAEYELGLEKRGLTTKYGFGSFDTHRMLLLWGPPGESIHTFGGAEIATTDGYGENRDARRASAMAQYEGAMGKIGSWRVAGSAYATEYHSAGLLREDDFAAGRKGFYDTYDFGQGGGGSRFSLSGDIESRSGAFTLHQQLFAVRRTMRLRENFTGFLLDVQEPIQEPHQQRGDLFDLSMGETTLGARGSAGTSGIVLGQKHDLELGYFVRGDGVDATRQRIGAGSDDPYLTETDLHSTLVDVGLYGDATVRATPWLSLHGGVRADLFTFDVLDACAVQSVSRPSQTDPPGDASCLHQQRGGEYREPTQRSSTAAVKLMPRVTLTVGPVRHFSFSLSYGQGVRSIDPNYITQDVGTPFASIDAYEGGVSYARTFGDALSLSAKSVFFVTHVDRDLAFSETEGRSILGGGTTRAGWSGSLRVAGDFFDENANVTLVRSAFDDTGLLVPYVPDVVVRSDTALFHDLPWRLAGAVPRATLGAGISYIGRRALPYGQRSDTIFTVDASATLGWRAYEIGVEVQNLLDRQYRLSELNFTADFESAPAATLVPARHFAAGAPRTVMVTFAATFGGS